MNGTLLAQFNIQGETDSYKQDYDTALIPFDLDMSSGINRNQITLAQNTQTLDNSQSLAQFGAAQSFLYIRSTQRIKLNLVGNNLTGYINMDRIFFTASQFVSFSLQNLNTLFPAQVLVIYG